MKEKFLPIGTVVLLKEATKRLMITGYCSAQAGNEAVVYDYVGCLFPEGNLAGDDMALFNHDQIGVVVHMGLDDDEFKNLNKNINELLANEEDEVEQATLVPFTPENINNIIKEIHNNEALAPISEPTAFNEEVIRKPIFAVPTLGGNNDDNNTEVESAVDIPDEEDDVPPVVENNNDGQPVLQLQPIYDNGVLSGDDGTTDSGLARL